MENKENIYSALAKFQGECPSIELSEEVKVSTKSGGSYSFKYASLPTIKETIKPYLAKHGLSYIQSAENGLMSTFIYHVGGEWLRSNLPFNPPVTASAQELGSWITYLKRYSLCAALGLVAEEDDDANVATGNTYEKKTQKEGDLKTGVSKEGRPWFAQIVDGKYKWLKKEEYDELKTAKIESAPRPDLSDSPF